MALEGRGGIMPGDVGGEVAMIRETGEAGVNSKCYCLGPGS